MGEEAAGPRGHSSWASGVSHTPGRGLLKEGPVCLGLGNVWGAVQVSRQGLTRGLWTGPLCLRRSGNLKNGGGMSVGSGGPRALPPAGSGRHGSGVPKRTRGSESQASWILASSSPAHGAAPRATRGGRTCGIEPWMGRTAPLLSCPPRAAGMTQREEIKLHGGLTCFPLPELVGDRQPKGSQTCQPAAGPVAWARLFLS